MTVLRVLVVEDSLTVRKRLCDLLTADPAVTVVGEAEDGKRGIELCQALRPDVVTMDMMLPVMSGLAATEYIMAHCPTPILIVSSSTNRGELFKTYEALAAGAVDVMEKPSPEAVDEEWARTLVATLRLVARVKVITHPRARLRGLNSDPAGRTATPSSPDPTPLRQPCQVVALGASTGGPGAIVRVLRGLPAGFSLPVLAVIHLDAPFAAAFAEWLDGQSAQRVSIAQDGQALPERGVLLAPPDRHLCLRNRRLHVTDAPPRHFCRPSVDVLFESLARDIGAAGAACLLTGMGRDGAAGLLAIRQAGGLTIAQDEATSVVYGMPREAVEIGAAERVLPVDDIGPLLARLAPRNRAQAP